MVKGVDMQGRGRWGSQDAPRPDKASLNHRKEREKMRLKKWNFFVVTTAPPISISATLVSKLDGKCA